MLSHRATETTEVTLEAINAMPVSVSYKSRTVGDLRLDLVVENLVVVEIKSVERIEPVFEAQVLTYLKVSGKKVGLLINFNSRLLKTGIQRFIL
jgi:GxxExxY protein